MTEWYEGPDTPDLEFWWAVEHRGHPAFYLRALMPGDFAPGRRPALRHALTVDGKRPTSVLQCGTCGETPEAGDLEPIERTTGIRGFLGEYRRGRARWPQPTEESSCWLCSDPRVKATRTVAIATGTGRTVEVSVCERCAAHLARRSEIAPARRSR
jgi:hypothetical protein